MAMDIAIFLPHSHDGLFFRSWPLSAWQAILPILWPAKVQSQVGISIFFANN